jgi:hypothetical protein
VTAAVVAAWLRFAAARTAAGAAGLMTPRVDTGTSPVRDGVSTTCACRLGVTGAAAAAAAASAAAV